MLRIDRPPGEVASLVQEATREAGAGRIARDGRGRIVGTKTRITATAKVVADLGVPESGPDRTYLALVGKYTARSQVPSLLGRDTPKVASAVRERLRELAGDDLSTLGP